MKLSLSKELTAVVSPEDFEWAGKWKWSATNCSRVKPKYYAHRKERQGEKRVTVYLHREIAKRKFGEIPDDLVVDHFPDTNGLNCTRDNLVLKTQSLNAREGFARYRKTQGEPWL